MAAKALVDDIMGLQTKVQAGSDDCPYSEKMQIDHGIRPPTNRRIRVFCKSLIRYFSCRRVKIFGNLATYHAEFTGIQHGNTVLWQARQ